MRKTLRAERNGIHQKRLSTAVFPSQGAEARGETPEVRAPRARAAPRKAQTPAVVGEVLLHPLCVLALLLWWCNDAFGKIEYPGWVTGKLSDVASLVVFPLLIWSLTDGVLRRLSPTGWGRAHCGRSLVLDAILLLTGALFAAINLSTDVATIYVGSWQAFYDWINVVLLRSASLLATHTVDPTDLLALPSLLVARWLGRRQCL